MNSITPALIDYWRKLPAQSAALRRQHLEEARRRVTSGNGSAESFIPFALADHDDEVVFAATAAYVGVVRDALERNAAAHDATEWVRRGLALNRGAVFAALLALGDDGINERLIPLRLALSADDVATVCRRAARRPCERSRAFLREWHELLSGEGATLEREHVAASLGIAQAQVA
jgi:hypothetical protein